MSLLLAILVSSALPDAVPAHAAQSRTSTGLAALVSSLKVAPEPRRVGYDRSLFVHWVDDDRDGCHARCEVLESERRTDGTWFSVYDGSVTASASALDVDHVVALAEAWDSGANRWTPSRRRAFANDLSFPGSLIAVSAAANRAKSDHDPATWRPSRRAVWCSYVFDWVTVKLRWNLTADRAEVQALHEMARGCPTAPGSMRPPAVSGSPSSSAPPVPPPSVPALPVFYATCADARAAGAAPLRAGRPGYRVELDRDRDGVACE